MYIFEPDLNKTMINNIRFYSNVKHYNLLESNYFDDKNNKFYYVEEAATSVI